MSLFKIISKIFQEHNVHGLLIGGYAVNSYKVTRHTADVDFMITKGDFEKIKIPLQQIGYQIVHQQEVFIQLSGEGLRDLDFMFSEDDTFKKLFSLGTQVKIAGATFTVPNIMHLIALKLHSIKFNPHRELNDLPDIVYLIQNNDLDINSDEFSQLFKKHGTNELYEKVKGLLK